MPKYNLSVGAIFKNESQSIKEWLEHYLFHGVQHFYLINDSSTDNFLDIIQPYIDQGFITLFNISCEYYLGRQKDMYNKYILSRIKETKWLLMVDLDEYAWSPQYINLNELLNNCNNLGQIQICNYIFGSNGYINQPDKIVKNFTKRGKDIINCYKYIVNSEYEFSSLNVHHATFVNKEHEKNNFLILINEIFINHYSCQSKNFWIEVKMTRGDSDNYHVRNMEHFDILDKNDVEDIRLLEQNKNIKYIIP